MPYLWDYLKPDYRLNLSFKYLRAWWTSKKRTLMARLWSGQRRVSPPLPLTTYTTEAEHVAAYLNSEPFRQGTLSLREVTEKLSSPSALPFAWVEAPLFMEEEELARITRSGGETLSKSAISQLAGTNLFKPGRFSESLSPDGLFLAAHTEGSVVIYGIEATLKEYTRLVLSSSTFSVSDASVSWSYDSRLLAIWWPKFSESRYYQLCLWDLQTGSVYDSTLGLVISVVCVSRQLAALVIENHEAITMLWADGCRETILSATGHFSGFTIVSVSPTDNEKYLVIVLSYHGARRGSEFAPPQDPQATIIVLKLASRKIICQIPLAWEPYRVTVPPRLNFLSDHSIVAEFFHDAPILTRMYTFQPAAANIKCIAEVPRSPNIGLFRDSLILGQIVRVAYDTVGNISIINPHSSNSAATYSSPTDIETLHLSAQWLRDDSKTSCTFKLITISETGTVTIWISEPIVRGVGVMDPGVAYIYKAMGTSSQLLDEQIRVVPPSLLGTASLSLASRKDRGTLKV